MNINLSAIIPFRSLTIKMIVSSSNIFFVVQMRFEGNCWLFPFKLVFQNKQCKKIGHRLTFNLSKNEETQNQNKNLNKIEIFRNWNKQFKDTYEYKVEQCLSVCQSFWVEQDMLYSVFGCSIIRISEITDLKCANRRTDLVILKLEAFYRPKEGL